MEKPNPKPAELMPKWWRIASTTVLYSAYLLWLIPFVLYLLHRGTTLLGALGWLVAVIVFQFVLANLVTMIEFFSTNKKIEALRRDDNAAYASQGDPE